MFVCVRAYMRACARVVSTPPFFGGGSGGGGMEKGIEFGFVSKWKVFMVGCEDEARCVTARLIVLKFLFYFLSCFANLHV